MLVAAVGIAGNLTSLAQGSQPPFLLTLFSSVIWLVLDFLAIPPISGLAILMGSKKIRFYRVSPFLLLAVSNASKNHQRKKAPGNSLPSFRANPPGEMLSHFLMCFAQREVSEHYPIDLHEKLDFVAYRCQATYFDILG